MNINTIANLNQAAQTTRDALENFETQINKKNTIEGLFNNVIGKQFAPVTEMTAVLGKQLTLCTEASNNYSEALEHFSSLAGIQPPRTRFENKLTLEFFLNNAIDSATSKEEQKSSLNEIGPTRINSGYDPTRTWGEWVFSRTK